MFPRKLTISLFVLFNTFVVVRANRPSAALARSSLWHVTDSILNRRPFFLRNPIDWYISWYSYATGTDLQGVMFSVLSRQDWSLRIFATYANGQQVLLPLPRQSPRTFWQRTFADNKEAKFHNNLYGNRAGQNMYAAYLCRQYPVQDGSMIQSVTIKVHSRQFVERQEALKRGHDAEGPYYDYMLDDYPCLNFESGAR